MLVIIHLRGGADGLNMLVPFRQDAYFRARPTIAVPRDRVIPLGEVGLHPALEPLLKWYAQGDLAFWVGVGLPNATLSHFTARDDLETGGVGDGRPPTGWAARWLDLSDGEDSRRNASAKVFRAVAFGETLPRVLQGGAGVYVARRLSDLTPATTSDAFRAALNVFYGRTPLPIGDLGRGLPDALAALADDRRSDAAAAGYPATPFGEQLYDVERLYAAGVAPEVVSVELDGWDTHFFQGGVDGLHAELCRELAAGLSNFCVRLGDGLATTRVLVMTEFGRRVAENGSGGTDHGRASVMMTVGKGIRGGKVSGEWGDLRPERLDADGNLPPTVDARRVIAETLGVAADARRLTALFPGFTPSP
ncbi:MAG: DUF1501 domain-containing protein [Chloracidobacterium sp.]|nr:DUF1501 domain-containing protein [Chloracidobacterium sp.]MDW8218228.1 DUF1501 domain-containing protein [Acidobacteriota bacterium]